MVAGGFGLDYQNEVRFALAYHGYAVLVPNTRGRGGYGEKLLKGIADGTSSLGLPYQDAIAGLDQLVAAGVSDPQKLCVLGHSYGGSLTEYAVTQTDRFRAAVVHEAPEPDLLRFAYPFSSQTLALLARDLYGVHNPLNEFERSRLIAESPGLNAAQIHTPTLLLFGARQYAETGGRPFFEVLRRYNVPAAFFVYDEGHVFLRPAAVADSLLRTIEWLDYWTRGIQFTNAGQAREYLDQEPLQRTALPDTANIASSETKSMPEARAGQAH
jgi:dipeptidyl aminopeptidase/acylaminoacyl peptidase